MNGMFISCRRFWIRCVPSQYSAATRHRVRFSPDGHVRGSISTSRWLCGNFVFLAVSASGSVGMNIEITVSRGRSTLFIPRLASFCKDSIGARSTTPSARFSSLIAELTTTNPPMLMPSMNDGSSGPTSFRTKVTNCE